MGEDNENVEKLYSILMSYAVYNWDLGEFIATILEVGGAEEENEKEEEELQD